MHAPNLSPLASIQGDGAKEESAELLEGVINSIFSELQIIAQRVGADFQMQVEIGAPGSGSYFDMERCLITLDAEHVTRNPSLAKFVAGHEGAHRRITIPPVLLGIPEDELKVLFKQIGFHSIYNALEDTAVNTWLNKTYPGIRSHTEKVYDEMFEKPDAVLGTPEVAMVAAALGRTPRFALFLTEIIRYWHNEITREDLPEDVLRALTRTLPTAHLIAESVPSSERDEEIFAAAQLRFELFVNGVWPEAKKLVEKDIQNEMERLAGNGPTGGNEQEKKDSSGSGSSEGKTEKGDQEKDPSGSKSSQETQDGNAESKGALDKLSKKEREELQQKAEEALEALDDALAKELGSKLQKEGVPSHEERREEEAKSSKVQSEKSSELQRANALSQELRSHIEKDMAPWHQAYTEVGNLIIPLYGRLKRFFRPLKDPEWEYGYQSGTRMDIDRAMQGDADPRWKTQMWGRRDLPTEFDYRFSLLIDRSGSMDGTKSEEALRAVVVVSEVFERLGIPLEIACFNDKYDLIKSFDERFSEEKREQVGREIMKTAGGTDIGTPLQQAYSSLLRNPGKNNFIIVVTDGESSYLGKLEAVIEDIQYDGLATLIGLGLGPGTSSVSKHFPHAIANMSVRDGGEGDFSAAFSRLLEELILKRGFQR